MEVISVINKFEDTIEEASTLPFSSKKILDKEVLETFLEEIRCHLPEDIKKAKWIQDKRTEILADTNNERAKIIAEAQDEAKRLVDESEIVREAMENARRIIDEANEKAAGIKSGAKEYANEILGELGLNLKSKLEEVETNRRELSQF